jgi:triacylglycerol esterase/lipase EstA (alpha/beta hydrolase family)
MLARFVRLTLLLELAAYGAMGASLHRAHGWSAGRVILAALAVALAARFLLTCATLMSSYIARSPRAPEQQLGIAASLKLLLGEAWALLKDNFYYLPWESVAVRPDPLPQTGMSLPVVLAHGYFSNRGYFGPLVRALEERGVSPVFTPDFPSLFVGIEDYVDELHAAIEKLAAATGQPRIVLVCHSMGGLAAREYMRRHGAARIAKLVTIASPHHGTVMASLGLGENSRQMRRGSAFLEMLARHESRDPPGMPATSIYSVHDNLVAPQDTSRLPWAKNIAIDGMGHVGILSSHRLHEILLGELRSAGVAVR